MRTPAVPSMKAPLVVRQATTHHSRKPEQYHSTNAPRPHLKQFFPPKRHESLHNQWRTQNFFFSGGGFNKFSREQRDLGAVAP
jgi:hypothetical protein